MKIALFTGFLGSGKTTLSLDFAKYLRDKGHRVAFIINEAGEIALDSQLAREGHYRVEEVYAGCICCQVSGNFIKALDDIIATEKPQWLLIEPSGVAEPASLVQALKKNGHENLAIINVIDLPRFLLLQKAIPLITSGLQSATMIMVSKLDLMQTPQELDDIKAVIAKYNNEASVFAVSKIGVPNAVWQEVEET